MSDLSAETRSRKRIPDAVWKVTKTTAGNRCVVCKKNERSVGKLIKAHIKAHSRGGDWICPMCATCHIKYDHGLLTKTQVKNIGLTWEQYQRLKPKSVKTRKRGTAKAKLPRKGAVKLDSYGHSTELGETRLSNRESLFRAIAQVATTAKKLLAAQHELNMANQRSPYLVNVSEMQAEQDTRAAYTTATDKLNEETLVSGSRFEEPIKDFMNNVSQLLASGTEHPQNAKQLVSMEAKTTIDWLNRI